MERVNMPAFPAQQQSLLSSLRTLITNVDEFSRSFSRTAPAISREVQDLKEHLTQLVERQELQIQSSHSSTSSDARSLESVGGIDRQGHRPPDAIFPAEPSQARHHSGQGLSEALVDIDDATTRNHATSGRPVHNDGRLDQPDLRAVWPGQDIQTSGSISGLTDIDQNDAEVNRCVDDMMDWLESSSASAATHDNARAQSLMDEPPVLHSMRHACKDGVFSFYPTEKQWPCFTEILNMASPADVPPLDSEARSYPIKARRDDTYSIDLVTSDFIDSPLDTGIESVEVDEAVAILENKLESAESLNNSRYCTDVPARSAEDRRRLGLSASPIWPLTSNKLDQTKFRVPGIHWPYAYKANSAIGAIFAMHIEGFTLYSLNVLYRGNKIWTIIPPSAKGDLESRIWTKRSHPKCAQFVRESATYVPTKVLHQWSVPHTTLGQEAGDIIVTLPNAYHEGFSVGATLAEAVNFADDEWDPTQYLACSVGSCPSGFVSQDAMALREAGEEQGSEDGGTDLEQTPAVSVDASATTQTYVPPGISPSRAKLTKRKATNTREGKASRVKRKEAPTFHDQHVKKPATVDELSRDLSMVISAAKIPPTEIYQEFLRLNTKADCGYNEHRCMLLTRLFFAIASPDAVCQLRDAYKALKSNDTGHLSSTQTIADAVRALDTLDANTHLFAIMRRFHLVSLCQHRDALLAETRRTRSGDPGRFGRSENLAHEKLMSHAYPRLSPPKAKRPNEAKDEYTKKSLGLTDRLKIGHRWSMLAKAFTPGILALVPVRGDYQLHNSDYERLPAPALRMLVDVLKQHRGQFLQEDADALKHEEYDSPRLVELCKVEHVLPPAMQ